jgi:hypothetical protein
MKADVVFLISSRPLEAKILCVGRRRNGVKSVFLGKESVFCVWPFLPKKRPGGYGAWPKLAWEASSYPAMLLFSPVFPALGIGIMSAKDCFPGLWFPTFKISV